LELWEAAEVGVDDGEVEMEEEEELLVAEDEREEAGEVEVEVEEVVADEARDQLWSG